MSISTPHNNYTHLEILPIKRNAFTNLMRALFIVKHCPVFASQTLSLSHFKMRLLSLTTCQKALDSRAKRWCSVAPPTPPPASSSIANATCPPVIAKYTSAKISASSNAPEGTVLITDIETLLARPVLRCPRNYALAMAGCLSRWRFGGYQANQVANSACKSSCQTLHYARWVLRLAKS